MNRNDELKHFGIKGMHWGHRKARPINAEHARYLRAKQDYKNARREYNKSFDKAYNRSIAAYSPFKKHRQANEERWKKVYDDAKKGDAARARLKAAKKEYKQTYGYKNKISKRIGKGIGLTGVAMATAGGALVDSHPAIGLGAQGAGILLATYGGMKSQYGKAMSPKRGRK